MTNQERLVITRAFKALDEQGDGELGSSEILKGLEKYCPDSQYTDKDVKAVIRTINIPNNGHKKSINYSQFCMAAINENVLVNKDKSKRLFHLFDFVTRFILTSIIE